MEKPRNYREAADALARKAERLRADAAKNHNNPDNPDINNISNSLTSKEFNITDITGGRYRFDRRPGAHMADDDTANQADTDNAANTAHESAVRKLGRGLKFQVNSDPDYKVAQCWGCYPQHLYKLACEYGFKKVKANIQAVASLADGYFKQGQPVGPQRGRMLTWMCKGGM